MFENTLNEKPARLEWLMIFALGGLMLLGLAFIYSAKRGDEMIALSQAVWYCVGIGAAAVVCLLDYHVLVRWSLVIYWGTILLLVVVLVPFIGAERFGARRWIDLGPFQFQPSEFAKLSFILASANYLSRPLDELRLPSVFIKGLGLMFLPFLLILKEPDLGS